MNGPHSVFKENVYTPRYFCKRMLDHTRFPAFVPPDREGKNIASRSLYVWWSLGTSRLQKSKVHEDVFGQSTDRKSEECLGYA